MSEKNIKLIVAGSGEADPKAPRASLEATTLKAAKDVVVIEGVKVAVVDDSPDYSKSLAKAAAIMAPEAGYLDLIERQINEHLAKQKLIERKQEEYWRKVRLGKPGKYSRK